jgi:acetyl-CoA carboxylase carboxyl transferase subunit beta
VVQQVTGALPPAESHTSDSAFRNGLLDALVHPEQQWPWLCDALLGPGAPLPAPPRLPSYPPVPRDAWETVLRARQANRPSGWDWATWICDGWVDLHGRDPSVRAGLAVIGGLRAVVVALDRHAYGDAAARQRPAGYRLAQRALALAARQRLPVLTLIDTPGAEPGPEAEADGVAGEIARTLLAMADLPVPTVALCVGEGGSGGAMALAHADRLLMLTGAVFSVIGPEAGAAILYRDAKCAPELARWLRLTAADLMSLGAVDGLVEEQEPGLVRRVRDAVVSGLTEGQVGDRDARVTRLSKRSLAGFRAGRIG